MASDARDDGYVPIMEDRLGPIEDWDDERGIYGEIDELEVKDLPDPFQKYLNKHVKNRYAERTWYNRVSAAKHWVAFCVRRWEDETEENVDYLNPSVVNMDDFVTDQLDAGYKHSSIEARVYDLSSMFKYFSKRGYADSNPIADDEFDMGVSANDTFQDIRYIEKEDFEKILAEAEKLRDRILLSVLWDCGVRSKEVVAIYEDDVSLEDQKITLKTAKQEGEREKDRVVFFTRRTRNLLKEWIEKGGRKQYLSHEESPYLLIGTGTEKLNPRRPTEIVREHAEAAGVQAKQPVANAAGHQRQKVTAHCFRHSFAVLRVKRGMPIVYLSDLMGHQDIQQTRVYLEFRDDDLKEAYKKYRP